MTPGKFRKKPVEVEAFQWTGQPPHHWPSWARDSLDIRYEISSLSITTARGPARGNRGDWVIKHSDGEIYPCPPATFERNYDPVE